LALPVIPYYSSLDIKMLRFTVSKAFVKSQKIPQTVDLSLICDRIWLVRMKQRGMGTWVVRAGSMNMQYKNMKVN
jgi:hypothetical protein